MNVRLCLPALLLACAMIAPTLPAADITVDTSKRHQTIEGFGTCLISWVPEVERLYQTEDFQKLYVDTMGCTILRVELWPDVSKQPIEDPAKIRWQDFKFDGDGHRGQVFVDFAAAITKRNPQVQVIGTTWSPPAWMKVNNSTKGDKSHSIADNINKQLGPHENRLKPEYYRHYAKWLAEWVKLFEAKGMRMTAVSPQNELMFSQSFNSCVYTPEEYAELLKVIGETFEAEGLRQVRLFGPEHMTFDVWWNTQYINALEKDGAMKHLDVFASHGYIDGFKVDKAKDSSAQLWQLISKYDKPFWMTEGGTGGHDWPAPLNDIAPMIHNSLVGGNASAWVPWQITDPEKNEHGLMAGDQMTKKTHVARHYFKHIRPGAVRVDATPADGDVPASAYLHPTDRTLTIVLTNPTNQEQRINLRLNTDAAQRPKQFQAFRTSETESFQEVEPAQTQIDGSVRITLPPSCIVTLHGSSR